MFRQSLVALYALMTTFATFGVTVAVMNVGTQAGGGFA